jgi:Tol biopolymer transport system component
MPNLRAPILAYIAAALPLFPGAASGAPGDISLISVRLPNPTTSMYASYGAKLSADGHYLAFFSTSPDLVAHLTNAYTNLFVRNLQTGGISALSINSSTSPFDANDSFSVSADGHYLAFSTSVSSLVAGDTNAVGDVFVRDLQSGSTTRVSVSSSGAQGAQVSYAPSISADGRFVAFASRAADLVAGDSNKADDVFVHDRQTGTTERVSVSTAGIQGNGTSFAPVISADGRYVAFTSNATNLVAGDTNGVADIFVHDRQTGTTQRVSVGLAGVQANGNSAHADISFDGRYVTFASDAANLVTGDTNGGTDVFVRDRQAGTTDRVSVDSAGHQSNESSALASFYSTSISADGRYVAFTSDASNLVASVHSGGFREVYVHDRLNGQTLLGSVGTDTLQAGSYSVGGSLSADGRYLAFDSNSSNLVQGDRNGTFDVFVRDRQGSSVIVASTNEVKSTAAGGVYDLAECDSDTVRGPSISADGRYVAFVSSATDLVAGEPALSTPENIGPSPFVRDRQTGKTVQVGQQDFVTNIAISADGSTVAVWGECAETAIINRTTGAVDTGAGLDSGGAWSSDGRFVAYTSGSSVVAMDRKTRQIETVSVNSSGQPANSYSYSALMSGTGRYVAFQSDATNLVPGDQNSATDVFLRDRSAGTTERVSVNSAGLEANAPSYDGAISADGRYVGFETTASNLVPGDRNGVFDVFLRDRQTGRTERVSVSSSGVEGNGNSYGPTTISADGRYVVFASESNNLVPGYTGSYYIRDRQTGVTEGLITGPKAGIAIATFTNPSISADERFVAFASLESLVKTDLNASAEQPVFNKFESLALDTYLQERAVSTSASRRP